MARASDRSWAGQRILVLSPTPTHPQDYGNRKRIYEIYKRISDSGGQISFAHYPSEAEWRNTVPRRADRDMAAAWSEYFTIPPTRAYHTPPIGDIHGIDEWWDDSIGDFLRWVFRTHVFDIFIVNYAWLSKAFEFAPPSVVKILDTHDKLSGRGAVLAHNGIEPEFFFTSEDEEALAFARADIVWAIKESEREQFVRMAATPVITLPHLDPQSLVERRSPDPDGYLRVGFIGARNSINRTSITNFLAEALPLFRKWLAPIKIVIAGSVCEELDRIDSPFLELRGRVDDVASFYASVDCMAVPMTFSTGLKIKTGEALSFGVPVIGTEHAFEGYSTSHPLHRLADHAAVAHALIDLSFAPRTSLDALVSASQQAYRETAKQIEDAYTKTHEFIRKAQPSIIYAVDSRAFVAGTVFNHVMRSVDEFLQSIAHVTILVASGSVTDLLAARAEGERVQRVVAAGDLEGCRQLAAPLAAVGIEAVEVDRYLKGRQPKVLIADTWHSDFEKGGLRGSKLLSRPELISLAGVPAPAGPVDARQTFIIANSPSRQLAALLAGTGADLVLAPHLRRSAQMFSMRQPNQGTCVVILGSPETRAVKYALALAEAWKASVRLVGGSRPTAEFAGDNGLICISASEFLAEVTAGTETRPLFALDMSEGKFGLQLCREILDRLQVPVATMIEQFGHRRPPMTIATEADLYDVFRRFMLEPEAARNAAFEYPRGHAYDKAAGWESIAARLGDVIGGLASAA